ncbi:unnamed protein product [Caenorhabditis auriculariae]|uniref:Uncharacterized protein n=1 Tax=Caenorhabditis auriculariae TaxID=2777116 RepID=A0A8S1HVU0_9PELO|nr:unnamed protein product [Caenorhabditis auriculariae]
MATLLRILFLTVVLSVTSAEVYDDTFTAPEEEKVEQAECAVNEVWMECSSCEQKCGQSPQPCPRVCQPARCQCPAHKGFKRDVAGKCVFCE